MARGNLSIEHEPVNVRLKRDLSNGCRRLLAVVLGLAALWLAGPASQTALAQHSVLDRLSGFDRGRVEQAARWAEQPGDAAALEDAAKLVYQLRRLDRRSLPADAGDAALEVGDAVALHGTATDIAALPLAPDLAELLEMPRLYRVTFRVDGRDRYVITESVPRPWLRTLDEGQEEQEPAGWPSAAVGVVGAVDAEGRPHVVAASSMQWYPTSFDRVDDPGIALLARNGFDASWLDEIAASQQQPLQSAEREAFYGMLKAAEALDVTSAPSPEPVSTVELLRDAEKLAGHWVRVDLETVRLSRIVVTEPRVLEMLGQDHYWQIDAMGDLGNVAVTVEVASPDPTAGDRSAAREGRITASEPEEVVFANRYPVSIAAMQLPDALREQMEQQAGEGAVVAMIRRPITVDGFFYRLWSYDSEFMQSQAGRQQFGPLLMASRMQVRPEPQGDARGAAMIGWIAATVFLLGVAVVVIGLWWSGRRDAELTRRRRQRQTADAEFPST